MKRNGLPRRGRGREKPCPQAAFPFPSEVSFSFLLFSSQVLCLLEGMDRRLVEFMTGARRERTAGILVFHREIFMQWA